MEAKWISWPRGAGQTSPGVSLPPLPAPSSAVLLPPADTDNVPGRGQGWSVCSFLPPRAQAPQIPVQCTTFVLQVAHM